MAILYLMLIGRTNAFLTKRRIELNLPIRSPAQSLEKVDMLRPRLQGYQPRSPAQAPLPFSEDVIAWTALLGGILPAAAVAFVNARRLRIPASRQLLIALIGLLDFAAVITVHCLFPGDGRLVPLPQTTLGVYVADRMIALLGCLLFYQCWRPEYRTHLFFGKRYLIFGQPLFLILYVLGPVQWFLTRLVH